MDWRTAPLSDLIAHIPCTHHDFLKRELPRLESGVKAAFHGERDRALAALPEALFLLKCDLDPHLRTEELAVFPAIQGAERAARPGRPSACLLHPIRRLQAEHDDVQDRLARLRAVTRDYRIPTVGADGYGELMQGLAELDRNLTIHVNLENDILFPRALALHREFSGL